jgi:hypothetical protein
VSRDRCGADTFALPEQQVTALARESVRMLRMDRVRAAVRAAEKSLTQMDGNGLNGYQVNEAWKALLREHETVLELVSDWSGQ